MAEDDDLSERYPVKFAVRAWIALVGLLAGLFLGLAAIFGSGDVLGVPLIVWAVLALAVAGVAILWPVLRSRGAARGSR